jgi:hypothetical protein
VHLKVRIRPATLADLPLMVAIKHDAGAFVEVRYRIVLADGP